MAKPNQRLAVRGIRFISVREELELSLDVNEETNEYVDYLTLSQIASSGKRIAIDKLPLAAVKKVKYHMPMFFGKCIFTLDIDKVKVKRSELWPEIKIEREAYDAKALRALKKQIMKGHRKALKAAK